MAGKTEWYVDFVQENYKPAPTDLRALFYFEAAEGINTREAIGRVASESSVGTWTTLVNMPHQIPHLMAKAYKVKGHLVEIAYPYELWEPGNMPQLLSGAAGNIFGMKAVKNLRLLDISLPPKYVRSFKGPGLGIEGVQKIFRKHNRPITATVPKPKVGFTAKEHAQVAYEAWTGGADLVKDDENLTSQPFNKFEERIKLCAKMRDKAEKETGDRKSALLNITAETEVMKKRAKMIADLGWEYAMVDVVTAGMAGLQTIRETCADLGLAIHAHRAMHAAFTRNPKHGVSMWALAKFVRLIGVDQLHIGTVVGKLESPLEEVLAIHKMATGKKVPRTPLTLEQDWLNINPVLPVSSGGLHPGLVPDVMKVFGPNIVIQAGGGIHGHPNGTHDGAMALTQAIDATLEGIKLEEYARTHSELAVALGKWGRVHPR